MGGLEWQVSPQIVPLDPLKRINVCLDHFGTAKFFFCPGAKFFTDFFENPKGIMFHKVVHDCDFACCLCVLWVPSCPRMVFKKISCFIIEFGGLFSVKMSKF